MSKIEQAKTYSGKDLEAIFFRPILSGPDALNLGIKVMYNMPVPTTLHFWQAKSDVLQKYGESGWQGGTSADKYQKTNNHAQGKSRGRLLGIRLLRHGLRTDYRAKAT